MHAVRYNRKTAPKVRDGRVQKKNDHRLTLKRGFVIDRVSPRKGFRHCVTKQDLVSFIDLIPDRQMVLADIERIILSAGGDHADGVYRGVFREKSGIIELAAWRKELVQEIAKDYFEDHRSIFEKINLRFEQEKNHVTCWFDVAKAKAFILVHVFVHELGHHRDFMLRNDTSSGEPFAEDFAQRLEDVIWPEYVKKFGQP